MTQPGQPPILLVGKDPALEYLLKRYARQSGCEIRSFQEASPEIEVRALRPLAVWFSSLEVLEAFQRLRTVIANEEIPIVVCSSMADEARASESGADYFFLHPVTYDCFLSTLTGTDVSQASKE
jgi:CheY-like chemotaxis protein